MCNWSQAVAEIATEQGIKQGIEQGIKKERANAIGRLFKVGVDRERIKLFGYTKEEIVVIDCQ